MTPFLAILPDRDYLIILGIRNLEVKKHGPTQSRKAKKGEA
jgi:hypothetical protein